MDKKHICRKCEEEFDNLAALGRHSKDCLKQERNEAGTRWAKRVAIKQAVASRSRKRKKIEKPLAEVRKKSIDDVGEDNICHFIIDNELFSMDKIHLDEILNYFELHDDHRVTIKNLMKEIIDQIEDGCILEVLRYIPRIAGERESLIPKGASFDDHFIKVRKLGEGAFGEVDLIKKRQQPHKNKLYALKTLELDQRNEEGGVKNYGIAQMFQNDSSYLSLMVYGYRTTDNIFMIFDYNAGGDLATMLENGEQFHTVVQVIMAELIVALKKMHNFGVIHCDLKPANIMVANDGHVCIIDFDMVRFASTMAGNRYWKEGTPMYFAPEMVEERQVKKGEESSQDWWALGIIFYELMSGGTPIFLPQKEDHQERIEELMNLIINQEIPKIPQDIGNDFLHGLLERDVTRRLQFVATIEEHPVFSGADWNAYRNKTATAPFNKKKT